MTDSSQPHYHHSVRMLIPFLSAVLGIPGSLYRDCTMLIQDAQPTPRALNPQNIPPESPFILAMNHYDRPGLGAWWGGAMLVATIAKHRTDPGELHPVMAREWWYPNGWERKIKQPLTRWAFGQIAKAYEMATLPPVNEEYKGTGGVAVRRALALTRGDQPKLVVIAPEGFTGANCTLGRPPDGAGLFLSMLSHATIPFLPAANFEDEDNVLTVNFGKPFLLDVPRALTREQRDREASRQVMVEIGKLLPEKLWGEYAKDIRCALESKKS
jgi:hypothetical protein